MNERFEKVKTHLKENHQIYIGVAVGFVAGTVVILVSTKSPTIIAYKGVVVFGKNNTVVANLARRGHPGWTIICNETGVPFSSQNYAAQCMNLDPVALSHHLNGKKDQVGGFTFTRIRETQ